MQKPAPTVQPSGKTNPFLRELHRCTLLSISLLAIALTGYPQPRQKESPARERPSDRPQEAPTLHIAFLTDIHVSPGTPSETNLGNIVAEINAGDYDFAVTTGDLTNTGADRWSFSSGNYLFIGFNTGPFLKMGDGHVREEDVQWIKPTLSREALPGRTVISLAHYPLGDGLDNWYEVTDILKQYNTRLVICGHGHHLSLHNFDGLPGIMGRSALINGSDIPGYNILTLRNDSAYLYEKKLNIPTGNPFIAFSLSDPSPVTRGRQSVQRPDTSINNALWPAASAPFHLQDSASIFTAVLPVDKHTIVYGNSQGEIIVIDPLTKKVRWRHRYTGSIYSTPVYGRGIIAFSTIDGIVHGLDIRTGKDVWDLPTGEPGISEGLVQDNALYIGTGSHFYKLHLTDGKILWKNSSPEGQLQARPVLSPAGDAVVFGAWDRHLYCLDAATGQLKWKWDNGRQVYAKLMNDTIISVSTTTDSFHINWESNAASGYEHNPCPILENNGTVYAGTKNGLFIAIDAATGKVLLEHKAGNSSINGITADHDGNVWISLIEGRIDEYKRPG
jgi:outer membrane protein assembly factor BamB